MTEKLTKQAETYSCPYSRRCGGCSLLSVPYAEQLRQKEKRVAGLLKPFCRTEAIIGMEDPLRYRNKVHAVFGYGRRGEVISGIYEGGSHRIVPVDDCLIENAEADAIIRTVRALAVSFKYPVYNEDTGRGFLRHILIRCAHATGQIMVVIVTASPVFPSKNNFVRALLKAHPGITTIVQNINGQRTNMVLGPRETVLYGKGFIEDVLCSLTFRISAASFYQINSLQTEKLYRKAVDLACLTGKERVIDAYCGIGTIGMTAASQAKDVTGIELNADAVRDAIRNAKQNGITNTRFVKADATDFMLRMAAAGEKADVLFMDPPRSGSTEAFLKAAAQLKVKRIVYVSCNPDTLQRDLTVLNRLRYRAVTAVPVDMFCFCSDVETVVLLSRKDV